ncbi:VOC family protein [Actinosynnema sp. NPDC050436]|uniref:VOC family protein n=1 Tax=Actinosynnema sp. NPDC050436 TaxID=3155659 RepID=UPI0034098065
MTTRLCNVVVDATDPAGLALFWSEVLERPAVPSGDGEVDVPLDDEVDLVVVPVDEPKQGKNRVHLDLASTSPEHQARLVARARELGASPVDIGQGEVPWVVLADPEGNEFCVLEPRDEYRGIGPVAAVVVDALDPVALAAFWSHAAGVAVTRQDGRSASLRRDGGFWLEFLRRAEVNPAKNRVHLDVAPPADGDQPTEVSRLEARGAVRSDVGQGAVRWVVLADPEGNEFCVLTPR